jgi:hypothetical protein
VRIRRRRARPALRCFDLLRSGDDQPSKGGATVGAIGVTGPTNNRAVELAAPGIALLTG